MKFYYVLLEPNLFAVLTMAFLLWGFLASFRKHVRLCLLLAIGFSSLRCFHDIVITHGYHPDFVAYFVPEAHREQSWKALFWLLAPFSLIGLTRREVQGVGSVILALALALTAAFATLGLPDVLVQFKDDGALGLIYNPSMNVALIACALPFAYRWNPWLWLATEFAAAALVVWTRRHFTPVFVYFTVMSATFLPQSRRLIWIFTGALFGAGIHFWREIPTLHGRLGDYGFFWDRFREHWSIWTGMGPGKFAIYGPMLQALAGKSPPYWFHLHSDWMELVLQHGVIGAALWLWVYAETLFFSYRNFRQLFYVTLGLGVFMVSYFPLHTSSGALLAGLCLTVLRKVDSPLRGDRGANAQGPESESEEPANHYR